MNLLKGLLAFCLLYFLSLAFSSISKSNTLDLNSARHCIEVSNGDDGLYLNCMSQYDQTNLDQDLRINDLEMRLDYLYETNLDLME